MTEQERIDFEALVKKRKGLAEYLKDEEYSGLLKIIIEQYSDQAHFVYELLQNADDAKATRAEFILSDDKLIFKHNGKRKFNVTDPNNKPKSGHGDINAITNFGYSNKNRDKNEPVNQIGKFGIGFKAIFKYSPEPAIYDGNFSFCIKDLIVPELLNKDHPQRGNDETLFEFPFSEKFPFKLEGHPPNKARDDIWIKLKELDCPLLFLSNLKEIKFRFGKESGSYSKSSKSARLFEENNPNLRTKSELITLTAPAKENQSLYLFSRQCNGGNYSVGYFLDDKNHLTPVDKTAFCFFPTKRNTGLKFIIHAPFLLSGSREGILAGDSHNDDMINLLAELAADSLVYLRDLKLIDDGILNILPTNEADFNTSADQISFKPFFTAIKHKMQSETLLPTKSGDCVSRGNAYLADTARLMETFSDEQLGKLTGNPNAAWVFTTVSRKKVDSPYLKDITHAYIKDKDLFSKLINAKFIKEFIEDRTINWFHRFYKWIAEINEIEEAKTKLFFLDENGAGKATAAFDDKGKRILFLPNNCGCRSIHHALLANPDTKKFLMEKIGIKEPSLEDEVYIKTGIENPLDLDAAFIESQSIEWLHGFYKWIAEKTYRIDQAKTKPLFLDENGKATAAFKNNKPILFLTNDDGYPSVSKKLLDNPDIEKFLTEKIGISEPSPEDHINTKIREKYEDASFNDDKIYFKEKIFAYYEKCPRDKTDDFTSGLKSWIKLRTLSGKYVAPCNLYMPEPKFIDCFNAVIVADAENPSRGEFLDVGFYLDLVGKNKENLLREFFKGVGVTEDIDNLKSKIKLRTLSGEYVAPIVYSYWNRENILYMPDPDLIKYFDAANLKHHFLEEDYLNSFKDKEHMREFFKKLGIADEVSYFTNRVNYDWNRPYVPDEYARGYGLIYNETEFEGLEEIYKYVVRDKDKSVILWKRMVDLNSSDSGKLKDNLVGICHYSWYGTHNYKYPLTKIIRYLKDNTWLVDKQGNFKKPSDILADDMAKEYGDLTSDSAREVIDFFGIPEPNLSAEQKELIDLGKKYKEAEEKGINVDELVQKELMRREEEERRKPNTPQKVDSKTIQTPRGTTSKSRNKIAKSSVTNYDRKLEKIERKNAAEKNKIERLKDLEDKISRLKKYSFGWFKALLELEILKSNENKSNNKTISISFGHVEFEEGTQRTLILKYPNRYIPQFMEDLENIPLELHTAKTYKKVEIEVAGIRHNTLSVKLKDRSGLGKINLDEVLEARINVTEPFFLLEELQKQFNALDKPDDYDMQANLCANIDFVFGPPGTGKTHNLAEKIIAMMSEPKDRKILVMTPTNKAADVLVNKIIALDKVAAYKNWLLRFGTTDDAKVEASGVFHDKTFDINSKRKNVTVTTIARFPYDYFMTNDKLYLRDINWDCIIFDEASMIMLAQILLPLYAKTPTQFIIAGDPFQIEPITKADLWKDENIYTLVGLNSFTASKTALHGYDVEKLTTQYRSVPAIGEIFSHFAYDGILKHNRANNTQRKLNIDAWLDIKTLNIIKFPVSAYESIYRSRRLNGASSYQIYSAIFTFEYVKYLIERLAENNPAEKFSVGIVAPYRAQADLIEKLFSTIKKPSKNIDVQIGTVHTFQGDECDILFAVFNTPPNISTSPEMFLNRKNIINVAISRARDYIFIVMPDDNTIRIENLSLVKEIEWLFAKENNSGEFSARELEKSIFGKTDFIAENSFSTGHQNVNVYALPERKYEIRIEDSAVDVQLKKNF